MSMTRAVSGAPELRWDVERIRKDFPLLHQEVHGRPLVYLDNAATTQKPQIESSFPWPPPSRRAGRRPFHARRRRGERNGPAAPFLLGEAGTLRVDWTGG